MAGQSRSSALDHVIVVVFENRSLDNVLGRLPGRNPDPEARQP
jgi:phospholipase C